MSLLQRLACVMLICLDAINLHSLVQASSVFSNVCMHHDPGQLVRTAGVISTSSLLHTASLPASSAASSSSSPTADAEHGPVMRAIRDARDDISWFSAFTLGIRQDLGFNAAVTTSEESFASSSVHEQLANASSFADSNVVREILPVTLAGPSSIRPIMRTADAVHMPVMRAILDARADPNGGVGRDY